MASEPDIAIENEAKSKRRGIQSLDIGLSVLEAFAVAQGPLTLTDLGQRLDMPPSKLHRYVSSFVNAGFIDQNHRSGAYDLGPKALTVGLAALNRNDFVSRASLALETLVERTGQTATLNVWGNQGPTVVRWERGRDGLTTALGLGSVLPLLESATGQVFLAYMPKRVLFGISDRHDSLDEDAYSQVRDDVRTRGWAKVGGAYIPGLHALAVPVLNWQGTIELAITLVSRDPNVLEEGGETHLTLLGVAQSLSVADPTDADRPLA